MQAIFAISQNVLRRALRSKIFVILLLFALGLILLSRAFEYLTIACEIKLIKDIGLASISFFTALIVIFLSGEAITGEIEEGTIYVILSRPITRWNIILGKFLGMIWAILLTLAVTSFVFFILLYLKQRRISGVILEALFFIFLEAAVISSIAIMFSSLSSSTSTSTIFTFFTYVVGHFNPQLKLLGERVSETSIKWAIKTIGWILPDLEYFNMREEVTRNISISPAYIGRAFLYAVVYTCAMLIIAYLCLRRREF